MAEIAPSCSRPLLLDIRDAASIALWHVAGSARLPCEELISRGFELPPAGAPAVTLLRSAASAACEAWLDARAAVKVATTVDGDNSAAARAALVSLGYEVIDGPPALGAPESVLWQASPFLPSVIASLRSAWPLVRSDGSAVRLLLDAGCGAGRNSVALALALREGQAGAARVVAIDNRESMVAKCASLAARHGLLDSDAVQPRRADVRALWRTAPAASSVPLLPGTTFDAYDGALFMRFVDKPALAALGAQLLTSISAHASSGSGCRTAEPFILAVEGFEDAAAHPAQPGLKLRVGETLEIVSAAERASASGTFSKSRWRTIEERVAAIEDGRPVVCVILSFDRTTFASAD